MSIHRAMHRPLYRPVHRNVYPTAGAYMQTRFDNGGAAWSRSDRTSTMADGPDFTLSMWFEMQSGDGANQRLVHISGDGVRVVRSSGNAVVITCKNTSGTTVFSIAPAASGVTAASGWHHLVFSCSRTSDVVKAAFDGVVVIDQSWITTAADLQLDSGRWSLCADYNGADMSDVRWGDFCIINEYIDLDTDLDKFITGTSTPVDLGVTGGTPFTADDAWMFLGGPMVLDNLNDVSGSTNQGSAADEMDLGDANLFF